MIDYSEMSDLEINKAVARHRGYYYSPPSCTSIHSNEGSRSLYMSRDNGWSTEVDYCNNPKDAWPIIIENSIGLVPVLTWNNRCFSLDPTEKWRAKKADWSIEIEDRNPLRAAMILFLMMNKEV